MGANMPDLTVSKRFCRGGIFGAVIGGMAGVGRKRIAQETKDVIIRQAKDGASDTRMALSAAPTKQSTAAVR